MVASVCFDTGDTGELGGALGGAKKASTSPCLDSLTGLRFDELADNNSVSHVDGENSSFSGNDQGV